MRYFKFALLMVALAFMGACTSDDDPGTSRSGKEIAARYNSMLFGENSDKWLVADENNGHVLYAIANDAESARRLAETVVGDSEWTPSERSYILPDGYGSVIATDPETEGLFLSLAFNVRDMKPLVLNIGTEEYVLDGENKPDVPSWVLTWRYLCHNCGAIFTKNGDTHDGCPVCGSEDYECMYPTHAD